MKSIAIDMTAQTFTRLTVIRRAPNHPRFGKRAAWWCRCACGRTIEVEGQKLRNGNTRSCGCLKSDLARTVHTTHQQCRTGAYRSWAGAKTRCFNPNIPDFKNYGGRGITMCDRWRDSFEAFLEDMGPRPAGHSIERLDRDGPYTKDNCVWAPILQQASNRRNNHPLTLNGETHPIAEWERLRGFRPGTLKRRILLGWSVARAFAAPVR